MAILLNPWRNLQAWQAEYARLLPKDEIRAWPDIGDPADIEYVIAWRMPRAEIAKLSNLAAIFSLGAGIDQWLVPGMPNVPIVRLTDPEMSNEMAVYALAWVARYQRGFDQAEAFQSEGLWEMPDYTQPWDFPVGILGYGAIGSRIGQAFADLGYPVNGWSRSGRSTLGVTQYAGLDELEDFLGASSAIISVLPNTEATQGLLDAERWCQFRPDSIFVNIGRGTVVADESDLLAALDAGRPGRAVLDVTDPEPPAEGSALFSHPKVTLTAHVAGSTQVRSAATLVAANIERLRAGQEPFPLLDRSLGY